MHPFFSTLHLTKGTSTAIYVQLVKKLISAITEGTLRPATQLPGSRQLAQLLSVHRKTVIRAYDDLMAQGWLESKTGRGTFVAAHLPIINPEKFGNKIDNATDPLLNAGFHFEQAAHLKRNFIKEQTSYHLDDGFPDPRLAPLQDLSRAYRTQLIMGNTYDRLGYQEPQGSPWLRAELADHFNETRGMKVTKENILITRGTVMGLYLTSTTLIRPGDNVILGAPGWTTATSNFLQAGANLLQIAVDEYGINTDELEQICKTKNIRLVYVTSHHHYPSGVSLRAERRIHLLQLASEYGFILFEDDYDYDFHYLNKPLSPLASADQAGMVLYCGSFTKIISPAFRVGYLVGSANVIAQLARLRRIVDRQGDTMLDNAMAELLQNGIIQRHLRKSLRLYRQRRDIFCNLLKGELSSYLNFVLPEGGMAVWATFDPAIDLHKLTQDARKNDLSFSDGKIHQSQLYRLNSTRLGFASSNLDELEQSVDILRGLLKKI